MPLQLDTDTKDNKWNDNEVFQAARVSPWLVGIPRFLFMHLDNLIANRMGEPPWKPRAWTTCGQQQQEQNAMGRVVQWKYFSRDHTQPCCRNMQGRIAVAETLSHWREAFYYHPGSKIKNASLKHGLFRGQPLKRISVQTMDKKEHPKPCFERLLSVTKERKAVSAWDLIGAYYDLLFNKANKRETTKGMKEYKKS